MMFFFNSKRTMIFEFLTHIRMIYYIYYTCMMNRLITYTTIYTV